MADGLGIEKVLRQSLLRVHQVAHLGRDPLDQLAVALGRVVREYLLFDAVPEILQGSVGLVAGAVEGWCGPARAIGVNKGA